MKNSNKLVLASIVIIGMICIGRYDTVHRQQLEIKLLETNKKAKEEKQIQDEIDRKNPELLKKRADEEAQIAETKRIEAEKEAIRRATIDAEAKIRAAKLDRERIMVKWSYFDRTDDMTGVHTVSIAMASSTGARGVVVNDQPYLHIQCRDNTTVAYIDMDSTMDVPYGEHSVHVLWKYGSQNKAVSRSFGQISDNRGFWFNTPIPVIKEMMKETTLKIRTSQMFSHEYAVAEFDLTDLSTAIEPIRTVCNW